MPELPEVETVVRQLASRITGEHVRGLRLYDDKLSVPRPRRLPGRLIREVTRRGKLVVLRLEASDTLWLAVHLRMTGRVILHESPQPPEPRHLRAALTLDLGALLFYDPRRFGLITLTGSVETLGPSGLDPTTPAFTPARLASLIAGSRQALKPWLLRQDRLAGLGNIYASEIPHAAGLHPNRPAASLTTPEIRRLHRATRRVLTDAIEHGGTTFSDFRDTDGRRGGYAQELKVYGRAGAPCPRCGAPILRSTQQQRSTFCCPGCQI